MGTKILLWLLLLITFINCHSESKELLKLSKWLSKPSYNFSDVPSAEKTMCQKHLELYTDSLSGKAIPKFWAIKSMFNFKQSFLCTH